MQLRGDPDWVARERAVRPRKRCIHERRRPANRPVRVAQPRDDLPRRDWGGAAGAAAQAVARSAGAGVRAARQLANDPFRRPSRHRHERESSGDGRGEALSRRPLLSSQRLSDSRPTPPCPAGGHSAAGQAFRAQLCGADGPADQVGVFDLEGAGVHLRRAFSFGQTSDYDPFLLLDDFRNDVAEDYLAGFPWHPHRGIETITYVLAGNMEHGDSLGNRGAIAAGDIQWMTAGSGIVHQEMPKGDQSGRMHGFQLWANLPSAHKMTAPRYQEVKAADIPELTDDDGTHVRIVSG